MLAVMLLARREKSEENLFDEPATDSSCCAIEWDPVPYRKRKNRRGKHPEVFDHVGLLVNKTPGIGRFTIRRFYFPPWWSSSRIVPNPCASTSSALLLAPLRLTKKVSSASCFLSL